MCSVHYNNLLTMTNKNATYNLYAFYQIVGDENVLI